MSKGLEEARLVRLGHRPNQRDRLVGVGARTPLDGPTTQPPPRTPKKKLDQKLREWWEKGAQELAKALFFPMEVQRSPLPRPQWGEIGAINWD